MNKIAAILIGAIAALHYFIAYVEMFAWSSLGPKMFKTFPADLFEPTTAMAANQGLYNVFLAAGLTWALFIKTLNWRIRVATFFLICVAVAGVFGAITVSFTILFVQTVPSVIALTLLYFGFKGREAERSS